MPGVALFPRLLAMGTLFCILTGTINPDSVYVKLEEIVNSPYGIAIQRLVQTRTEILVQQPFFTPFQPVYYRALLGIQAAFDIVYVVYQALVLLAALIRLLDQSIAIIHGPDIARAASFAAAAICLATLCAAVCCSHRMATMMVQKVYTVVYWALRLPSEG